MGANSLASELWKSNDLQILMRIGETIRVLHPTDENLFEDLILWRKALRYKHTLREDLLDLLYRVFQVLKTRFFIKTLNVKNVCSKIALYHNLYGPCTSHQPVWSGSRVPMSG